VRTICASPWTPRPRRTSRPHPPFLAAQYPNRSPLPSFAHSQHLALASHCARTQGASPPSAVVLDLFRGHRRVPGMSVALVSSSSGPATRDNPRFAPSPSVFHCLHSPESSPCSQVSTAVDQGPAMSSPSLKPSRAVSRGNQPTHALKFPVYYHVIRAIARRSRCAPPSGHSAADHALRCLRAIVVPTVESVVSPRACPSLFPVP
jgi:hypothetical protein